MLADPRKPLHTQRLATAETSIVMFLENGGTGMDVGRAGLVVQPAYEFEWQIVCGLLGSLTIRHANPVASSLWFPCGLKSIIMRHFQRSPRG